MQIPRGATRCSTAPAGRSVLASTKTFLAQIAANYLLDARGIAPRHTPTRSSASTTSGSVPDLVARSDRGDRTGMATGSPEPCCSLGCHVGYPMALEGALKLRGWPHMRASARPASSKHGPIALIEDGLPVIVVMPSQVHGPLHAKRCPTSVKSRPAVRDHRDRRGGRRSSAPHDT